LTYVKPELLALAVVVDLTELGAFLFIAAAEAVSQPGRFSIVCVIGCDVTAMTAFVRLHTSCTVDHTRVAACTLLSTPMYSKQKLNSQRN